jgi:hypothetical protein
MNYTKPEVAVLGEAVGVIESFQKPGTVNIEPSTGKRVLSAAYDLDE